MPPPRRGAAAPREFLGVFADQRRRVAERDGRGVGVAAVGDDLQRHRLVAPASRSAVALRNRERDPRPAPLQIGIDVPDRRRPMSITGEVRRRVELRDQVAARADAIAVRDDHRHVLDVRRRRIAEQRQLDDRRDDDDAEETRVLAQLEELLAARGSGGAASALLPRQAQRGQRQHHQRVDRQRDHLRPAGAPAACP